MLLLKGLNSVQGLCLDVPAASPQWLFWGFAKLFGDQDSSFCRQRLQFIQTEGGKNVYEISNFLKPVNRLMYPYALKKVHSPKTHVLSSVQKKIFPYIQTPQTTPGLFNHRIRSWFVSLTQSILIRCATSALCFCGLDAVFLGHTGKLFDFFHIKS
jgi:hypothetical protein